MFGLWFILTIIYGACVGSFLNVVAYRLPAGKSLIKPNSYCPSCGESLRYWENVPVLAWFYLGGKCAHCKKSISFQYPLIEIITAVFFGGLFWVYYHSTLNTSFAQNELGETWPILVLHLILVSGLIVSTLIDARLFIIPLQIPWLVTLVAFIGLPAAAMVYPQATLTVMHDGGRVYGGVVRIALGGLVGLLIAIGLLQVGVLPMSFLELEEEDEHAKQKGDGQADTSTDLATDLSNKTLVSTSKSNDEQFVELPIDPNNPEAFLDYPHPRREMLKEILFIFFPVLGMVIGFLFLPMQGNGGSPMLRAFAGSVFGYLIGGGVVWLTRILGTLAFGKEAMGLGDVHLLAAVGAVLGPIDPMLAFFIAPFFGLIYALGAFGFSRLMNGKTKVIPYGPYLAGATLIVMVFREMILAALT